jgi:hypothetical protein
MVVVVRNDQKESVTGKKKEVMVQLASVHPKFSWAA